MQIKSLHHTISWRHIQLCSLISLYVLCFCCCESPTRSTSHTESSDQFFNSNDLLDLSLNELEQNELDTGLFMPDISLYEISDPTLGGQIFGPVLCGNQQVKIEQRIRSLLRMMTVEEKIAQMHGLQVLAIDDLYYSGENERLEIPAFRMVDGPRGVRAGNATTFPVAMARGASWNPQLEQKIGEAIGAETRGKGGNVILAPCINVLRHPRWGRAQETYGEDPMHIGQLGVAFVQGAQEHVAATAKHFAVNSIENTRFEVDIQIEDDTLREVYLPHFEQLVTEGKVATVMTAYNQVNGSYCSSNEHLVRDILKGEWGFRGVVMSDWLFGVHDTLEALVAGLDIEMPVDRFYGPALLDMIQAEQVDIRLIDDAVARILRVKLCYEDRSDTARLASRIESEDHAQLALQAAREGSVLLRNQNKALPFDRTQSTLLVVMGHLANVSNLGDLGSSTVIPSRSVTALEGIRLLAGDVDVHHISNTDALSVEEIFMIEQADAVVIVTGLSSEDEGESLIAAGDRSSLLLNENKTQLISNVSTLNSRTIVVLEGGSAMIVDPWFDEVAAILLAWYPGQEGGIAIAELLFGDSVPSGKLPITFPKSEEDLPTFDNINVTVNYEALHGYKYLIDQNSTPRYAFGHGLSYTEFDYWFTEVDPMVLDVQRSVNVSIVIQNAGARIGTEVIQVYLALHEAEAEGEASNHPISLKGFQRVTLEPGMTETVNISIPYRAFCRYNMLENQWKIMPGTYTINVGSSSQDLRLSNTIVVMPQD
jgi:beta-glucosidase